MTDNPEVTPVDTDLSGPTNLPDRIDPIAEHLPGIIFRRIHHPDGRVTFPYVSQGYTSLIPNPTGRTEFASLEETAFWVHPEDRQRFVEAIRAGIESQQIIVQEIRSQCRDRVVRHFRMVSRPVYWPDGSIICDGVLLDITDLKNAVERERVAARDRQMLLRELHHRVKNNMQMILSLLQIERSTTPDPAVHALLERIGIRIAPMGMVHEQLYRTDGSDSLDLGAYLDRLATGLSSLAMNAGVDLEVIADPMEVLYDEAVPIGLIVNEAVTNSLKHAFPVTTAGARVRIELTRTDQETCLMIMDNGIGMSGEQVAASTGLLIIRALAEQIHAHMDVLTDNGTCLKLTFKSSRSAFPSG